jgi:predicted homoserine dehydrogenase-like protein
MIGRVIAWIMGSRVGRWLALAGAVIMAVAALRWDAARDAIKDAKHKQAKADLKTVKDVGDAIEKSRADGASWHDRLRKRSDK